MVCISFRLWNQNNHTILYIHKQTIPLFDVQFPARNLRNSNLVFSADFDRNGSYKISLLSKNINLLKILSYSLHVFSLHPLTDVLDHLAGYVEVGGALEAVEIRLAIHFQDHRLVVLRADVYGCELPAQGAGR
jgi:hypothetical protein